MAAGQPQRRAGSHAAGLRQAEARGRVARVLRRGLIGLALSTMAIAPSCKAKDHAINIDDPCDLRSQAVFAELDLFEGLCPPPDDAVADTFLPEKQFFLDDPEDDFPKVGDVAKKKWGFAVVLRNATCNVIGYGCTVIDLNDDGDIDIAIGVPRDSGDDDDSGDDACDSSNAIPSPGPCPTGIACTDVASQCGGTGDDDDDGGAAGKGGAPGDDGGGAGGKPAVVIPTSGCDPKFIAGGELSVPKTASPLIQGPSVATAGDNTFFIAYRERSSDGTTDLDYLVTVADDGSLAKTQTVQGIDCKPDTGPPVVAYGQSSGFSMAGVSGSCTGGGGIEFFGVAPDGAVVSPSAFQNGSDNALPTFAFSGPRGLTTLPDGNFLGAYITNGSTAGYIVVDPTGAPQSSALSVDSDPHSFIATAAADKLGFVIDGDPTVGKLVIVDASMAASPIVSPETIDLPKAFPASLAAFSDHFFVVQAEASDFQWGVYQSGLTTALGAGSTSVPLKSIDVAVLGDHGFVATGSAGKVAVSSFSGLSGLNPQDDGKTTTTDKSAIASLSSYDGTQIGIAAGGERVLVAWTNAQPGKNVPAGGWAMYYCKP